MEQGVYARTAGNSFELELRLYLARWESHVAGRRAWARERLAHARLGACYGDAGGLGDSRVASRADRNDSRNRRALRRRARAGERAHSATRRACRIAPRFLKP